MNLLNLLFLMFIAFLPLPTEVLGTYMTDEVNQVATAIFYAIGLLLSAAGWPLVWLYAARGHRLIDERLDARFVRRLTMQYTGSVALYAIAVLVSVLSCRLGLAICIGLTLLYLLPTGQPVYQHSQDAR